MEILRFSDVLVDFQALAGSLLKGPCSTPSAQAARNCFISLAKTSPEAFLDHLSYCPAKGDLANGLEASIWMAANSVFWFSLVFHYQTF